MPSRWPYEGQPGLTNTTRKWTFARSSGNFLARQRFCHRSRSCCRSLRNRPAVTRLPQMPSRMARYMPASHCPEVDIKWTHDEGKFSNSALIVNTSGHSWGHLKPSYDRRCIFQARAATSWAMAKSLACQKKCPKTLRRFIFVLIINMEKYMEISSVRHWSCW